MSERQAWEAGTWEGARRAQLRRALRLSVRERLEVMVALTETAERLAEIGASSRRSRDSPGGPPATEDSEQ